MNTSSEHGDADLSAPTDAALAKLLASVASLCTHVSLTEDDVVRLIRAAYQEARSAKTTNMPAEIDAFVGAQVLSEWHQNPKFLNRSGGPESLSISTGSFNRLCEAASSSAQSDAVMDLLLRTGAVIIDGDTVSVQRRDLVIVGNHHPAAAKRAIWLCGEYVSTITHNLTKLPSESGRFERTAVSSRLSERQVPSLLAYLGTHGQSFLEDVDSWMSARESQEPCPTVGVGVYLFVADENRRNG